MSRPARSFPGRRSGLPGLLLLAWLALVLLPGEAAAEGTAAQRLQVGTVDTSGFPRVEMTVSAPRTLRDRNLPPDAFRVLENGKVQPVEVSRPRGDDLRVAVLIDTSATMDGAALVAARTAGAEFVRALPSGARVTVVSYGDDPVLVTPPTTDRQAAAARIRALTAGGETALYDAVSKGLDQLPEGRDVRRVVVVLAGNKDSVSATPVDAILRKVSDNPVDFYAIGLVRTRATSDLVGSLENDFPGRIFGATRPGQLSSLTSGIATDLHNQYRLRFQLKGKGQTEISVRLDHQGVVAEQRQSVILPRADLDAWWSQRLPGPGPDAARGDLPAMAFVLGIGIGVAGAIVMVLTARPQVLAFVGAGTVRGAKRPVWPQPRRRPAAERPPPADAGGTPDLRVLRERTVAARRRWLKPAPLGMPIPMQLVADTPTAVAALPRVRVPAWDAAAIRRAVLERLEAVGPVLLTCAALIAWGSKVRETDLGRLTDLGLAPALPVQVLAAPVLLTLAFVWSLVQRPLRVPVLLLQVVVLIVVLYGMTGMIEPVPGYKVVWRHAGVVDYIARTGTVDPTIDAYFNWPGFFILTAFVTDVLGLGSATSLGPWAPVFFNLLYLGPLWMLMRAVTGNRRLIWLGVWLFFLSNWVTQDYFSPQALTYFFYLLILAILLRWFAARPDRPGWWPPVLDRLTGRLRGRLSSSTRHRPAPPAANVPWQQRLLLMAVVIGLFAAAVSSHQLTPFAILAGVSLLVVFGRCQARRLPVLMAVLLATWAVFMAATFFEGHLGVMTADLGKLQAVADANLTDRLQGSAGHVLVVRLRIATVAILWSLALLGWFRRWRSGQDDASFVLLALAPFPLLPLQAYGGEMLLRVYFLALPFVAFFAAAAFLPRWGKAVSRRRAVTLAVACLVLLGFFSFARYGNERADYFTRSEVGAVQRLYAVAEPGSLLLAAVDNLPWKAQSYETYSYVTLDTLPLVTTNDQLLARSVIQRMRSYEGPGAYLIITRAQRAFSEGFGTFPPDYLDRLERALVASKQVRLMYENPDAQIYTLVPPAKGT